MKLEPADYIEIMRAAQNLTQAQSIYVALMRKHGLDPACSHEYDDRALTVTPKEPPVEQMLRKSAGRRK